MSHHPRAGIAASSQKMQRGVESPVLGKAQIGPVFGKPAKAEVSPLWSWKVQPWGTGNVLWLCLVRSCAVPGCRTEGSALRASGRSLNTQEGFLLNKTSRFCEEEPLPAVRVYRLRSCACTLGVQVPASTDMSELIFS